MILKKSLRILIGLFALTASATHSIAQENRNALLPVDPSLRFGRLSNGFTYYIKRNTVQENKVIIYLINKVGSILENEKQRGLAHFLEHMAFNGTAHYPKNELLNYLQKSGVRFGADLNAFTGFNVTEYQLPILLKDSKQIHDALQVTRDWAQSVTLDDEEIEKERGVIMSEKRLHKGLEQRIEDKTDSLTYNGSLYGDRAPIGLEEVILHSDHKEIRDFYHDWYRPDLQALVIVGDIDVNQVEKEIKSLFSDLKMPGQPKLRKEIGIPLLGKNQFLVVTDPEIKQPAMDVTIKFPRLVVKTKSDYIEGLSRNLISIMSNDRFNEIMQLPNPPFLSAGVQIGGFEGGLDILTGGVTTKPGELETGARAWWHEMLRMKVQGFTKTELSRAKEVILAGLDNQYKDRDKLGADVFVAKYGDQFLTGATAMDIEAETKLAKSALDTLGVTYVNDLFKKYLKDTDRDIIIKEESNQTTVSESEVTRWINEEASKPFKPYEDKALQRTALIDNKPLGGQIVNERSLPDVGATELKLSNGIRVLLKPTKIKNDQLLFNGYSKGGLSQVSDANFYSGNLAATIVGASGAGNWSALELNRWMERNNTNVSPYIDDNYQGIAGSGEPSKLEEMMQLITLYFTNPRRDPIAFNNLMQQVKSSIESNASIPQAIFSDTVKTILGDHQFRKSPMPLQRIDEVNLDRALEVYRDRFKDASGFTFTFVGNFDIVSLKKLAAQYLGSLPALNRQEEVKDLHLFYPTGRIARKVIAGSELRATVVLGYPGRFDFSIESNRQMDAIAKILEFHLISHLREDEGGIYTVNSSLHSVQYPTGQYLYTINFDCDPENVESLILSANSEIASLKSNGPTDDDVEKFKAEYRAFMVQAFNDNGIWLDYLTNQLQIKGEPGPVDISARLKLITKESLQATAQKYFNSNNYVRIILLPKIK
ncbi:M16 family metallopeptidase [Mucilaginibacter ginsenosidivorax]|uniref:Insulinase family protein n=1 Tax=Mucilaginibacter ginsenosidivorax TaxID=862126 RepID=A0A5B8W9H5_9SPHI|nr:M16 family metallopeptidase [Mucilaginibacter ginsenosidivorax]QEC78908.1 insulinase family protein [Mucilaginibacter ginsenosidivorax]